MPTYPEDEFDRIEPTGRRGAHRREPESGPRGAYVLIAVVAVIAVVLVVGVVNIVRSSFSDPEGNVAQDPPAATETEDPGEDPEETTEPEDTEAPEVDVDKEGVSVGIYNGSGVDGAAALFAEYATEQGWAVDEILTFPNSESSSIVYYSAAEYEVQAAALAAELGVEDIEESADFPTHLTALINSDIADDGPPSAEQ